MGAFVGEIAALAAALCFSITSVCYTLAGRKINAVTSIAMSLPISWLMLVGIHQASLGALFPLHAGVDRWFYLGVSGILAFGVTSYFWLNAYQDIGPRLTMLVGSFAPVLGALLAWLFLGQTLRVSATLGIALVIFGIVWVVAERNGTKTNTLHLNLRRGVIYACLGVLAQGTAFVFASKGVSGEFSPISATLIRTTAAVVALWLFIAYQRRLTATAAIFKNDARLFWQLSGAALSGPVIGGILLLLSFQFIPVGVSTTLSHTTAIILIPIGCFLFKERITPRAVVGTLIAIAGIAVLFTG